MSIPPTSKQHLDPTQRRDWLQLMRSDNVGPVTFRLLLNRYGSAAAALEALPALSARGGLPRRVSMASREEAEDELDALAKRGGQMVVAGEEGYPPLLARTEGAPPLLAIMGDCAAAHRPCIGIVGARNASATGLKVARMLAHDLTETGFTIVSGLARGIDTAAHQASARQGTLAVLAGGLAKVYPDQNRALADEITEAGLLISEMHLNHTPRAQDFPRRNRIIAGCSHGIIVVEAAQRSGSLITARLAVEHGRDVFAVPGSVLDPRADGTNTLIRQGATLITEARHVIEALAPQLERASPPDAPPGWFGETRAGFPEHTASPMPETPEDAHLGTRLLDLLSSAPIDFDSLCCEARAPAGQIAGALLELELAGQILRHPGNRLSRSS